ncbi:magnesium transporter NIPA protein [Toxoplasma gondii TgCatPRC2]|uniref:Magnesium transporter NIPA protein n=1 Tax=Toxoplasma gondii TgCatPRC2 TaxID=1130821 RepID=A0A151HQT1_TOXGO|nr:magnesium transporter NIPA protein [Toxoplasma gondii TgCatPRC2]
MRHPKRTPARGCAGRGGSEEASRSANCFFFCSLHHSVFPSLFSSASLHPAPSPPLSSRSSPSARSPSRSLLPLLSLLQSRTAVLRCVLLLVSLVLSSPDAPSLTLSLSGLAREAQEPVAHDVFRSPFSPEKQTSVQPIQTLSPEKATETSDSSVWTSDGGGRLPSLSAGGSGARATERGVVRKDALAKEKIFQRLQRKGEDARGRQEDSSLPPRGKTREVGVEEATKSAAPKLSPRRSKWPATEKEEEETLRGRETREEQEKKGGERSFTGRKETSSFPVSAGQETTTAPGWRHEHSRNESEKRVSETHWEANPDHTSLPLLYRSEFPGAKDDRERQSSFDLVAQGVVDRSPSVRERSGEDASGESEQLRHSSERPKQSLPSRVSSLTTEEAGKESLRGERMPVLAAKTAAATLPPGASLETADSLSPQTFPSLPDLPASSSEPSFRPASFLPDPDDLSLPPTICFFVGIIVSLVGTLLSALGDVCIRYSFVRNTPGAFGAANADQRRTAGTPWAEAESLTVLPLPPTCDILTDPSSSPPSLTCSPPPSFSSTVPVSSFPSRVSSSSSRRERNREGGCPSEAFLPGSPSGVQTAFDGGAEFRSPRMCRSPGSFSESRRRSAVASFSFPAWEAAPEDPPASLAGDDVAACSVWPAGWDPLWAFGIFCSCVVSPLLSIVSLSLLPANITGFGALQILFVVLLARFVLGEVVDKVNLTGGVFVVSGLVTITLCAASEPPLPDTATLSRQLRTPAAIVYEIFCLIVVTAGIALLLFYPMQRRSEQAAAEAAAECLSVTAASRLLEEEREERLDSLPRSSGSHSQAREVDSALWSQGVRTLHMQGARQSQRFGPSAHTFEGEGGCPDNELSDNSVAAVDEQADFSALGDGGEEENTQLCSSPSESEHEDSPACVCRSLSVWHHVLLPATGGVLGAVASISIKLIQAFFLSFSDSCIASSPSTAPAAVWPVIGMLLCLLNPVFLFQHAWLPVLFLVVACSALLELLFLSQSLRHYPASETIPIMNATLTVFMGLGGVIIFNEPPLNPLGWAAGLASLVLGVVVLGFGGKMWKYVHSTVWAGRRVWVASRRPPGPLTPGTPRTGLSLSRQASMARFEAADPRHFSEIGLGTTAPEECFDPGPWRHGVGWGEAPVARWFRFGSANMAAGIVSGERQRRYRGEHRLQGERVAKNDERGGEGGTQSKPLFGGLLAWLTKSQAGQETSSLQTATRRGSEAGGLRGISDFQAVVEDGEGWGRRGRTPHSRRNSVQNPLLLRSEQELTRL